MPPKQLKLIRSSSQACSPTNQLLIEYTHRHPSDRSTVNRNKGPPAAHASNCAVRAQPNRPTATRSQSCRLWFIAGCPTWCTLMPPSGRAAKGPRLRKHMRTPGAPLLITRHTPGRTLARAAPLDTLLRAAAARGGTTLHCPRARRALVARQPQPHAGPQNPPNPAHARLLHPRRGPRPAPQAGPPTVTPGARPAQPG